MNDANDEDARIARIVEARVTAALAARGIKVEPQPVPPSEIREGGTYSIRMQGGERVPVVVRAIYALAKHARRDANTPETLYLVERTDRQDRRGPPIFKRAADILEPL